jgi:hypothetical protein
LSHLIVRRLSVSILNAFFKKLIRKPEKNQSEYAFLESLLGGFFLRKKPLDDIASGYSNSGFAIAPAQYSPGRL